MSEIVKLVIWFKRRPALSVESFQAEWRGAHVDKALRVPGLCGYVQSHVLVSGYRKGEPFCDGVAELWFADVVAANRARASHELAEVERDAGRLCDVAGAGAMLTVEHTIKDGPTPAGGVKNIEFVVRR